MKYEVYLNSLQLEFYGQIKHNAYRLPVLPARRPLRHQADYPLAFGLDVPANTAQSSHAGDGAVFFNHKP